MTPALPDFVVPRKAGAAGLTLAGELLQGKVERLAAAYQLLGPVEALLRFSAEGERRTWVRGHLQVRAEVQCQRCLEAFSTLLSADVEVGFGAALDDDSREILGGLDDELVLGTFIEDELLLGAPMVFRHPAGECGSEQATTGDARPEGGSPAATRRPFEQLSSLLAARDSKSKTGD